MLKLCSVVPVLYTLKDSIALGITALEKYGYTNVWTIPKHLYIENYDIDSYYWKFDKKPPEEYIDYERMCTIPTYAFLEAIKMDGDEQPMFETLAYMYGYRDTFPDEVRELNKKVKLVSDEQLEYYLDFWGITNYMG